MDELHSAVQKFQIARQRLEQRIQLSPTVMKQFNAEFHKLAQELRQHGPQFFLQAPNDTILFKTTSKPIASVHVQRNDRGLIEVKINDQEQEPVDPCSVGDSKEINAMVTGWVAKALDRAADTV